MSEPIRVLQIVGAMYPGGLENFIMNLYEHIDREKVQFDFAVHARKENDYVEKIENMGGRVYLLPRLSRHPVKSLNALQKLLNENDYKMVIRHTANALVSPQLLVARRSGIKAVCHSHTSTDPQKIMHYLGRMLMKKATDVRIACSPEAGKWMYGNLDYKVIKNAIDIEKFIYRKEADEKIREEFGCQDAHIYGHIGNFVYAKNHLYLMDIFSQILNIDENAMFICVGEGELRADIEAKIKELGIEKKVILTGMRKDAPDFMSAMDVMIFPSIYEGLPLTLVEAQAASLPCIISDVITRDVSMTKDLIEFRSISEDASEWAKRAYDLVNSKKDKQKVRIQQRESIASKGYDIQALADWYMDFFEKE